MSMKSLPVGVCCFLSPEIHVDFQVFYRAGEENVTRKGGGVKDGAQKVKCYMVQQANRTQSLRQETRFKSERASELVAVSEARK